MEPPDDDGENPEAKRKAAHKAYRNARFEVHNAQNRFVKAFDAWMQLADLGEHVHPSPRPKGFVRTRKGKWLSLAPVAWYHWENALVGVGGSVLLVLVASGLYYWFFS